MYFNVFHTHLFMFMCEFMYIFIYDIMYTFMFISCVCVCQKYETSIKPRKSLGSTEFPLGFASPSDATDGTQHHPAFWKGKLMIFCTIASAPNPRPRKGHTRSGSTGFRKGFSKCLSICCSNLLTNSFCSTDPALAHGTDDLWSSTLVRSN